MERGMNTAYRHKKSPRKVMAHRSGAFHEERPRKVTAYRSGVFGENIPRRYMMSITSPWRFTKRTCLIPSISRDHLRSALSTAWSGRFPIRRESNTMFGDCQRARLRLRSTALTLLDLGAFISHSSPSIIISAVRSCGLSLLRTKVTSCPAAANASAVRISCGQTFAPSGLDMLPTPSMRAIVPRRPKVYDYGKDGTETITIIGRVVWHTIPFDWAY